MIQPLTHKQLEMQMYWLKLKHQAIIIHIVEKLFLVLDQL